MNRHYGRTKCSGSCNSKCRDGHSDVPARRQSHHQKKSSNSSSSSSSRSSQVFRRRRTQQQQPAIATRSSSPSSSLTAKRRRYRNLSARLKCLPRVSSCSLLTLGVVVCLQLLTMPTVLHCAKTFYMHWNTTNSIFRIDNTDHIIDVNKGNSQFEYDQVHIICPVYEPGTFDNETEKYIIYNVSKVEYETCRITNHDPRIIAICDKPNKLMFFTITFRPFTPQPGGLEFLPGNDYYFISTSSKDDLHRRIGGRCTTDNMKVVFKVCCADDQQQQQHQHLPPNGTVLSIGGGTGTGNHIPADGGGGILSGNSGVSINTNNTISIDAFDPNSRLLPPAINSSQGNIVQSTVNWPVWNGGQQRPVPSTPSIGANGRHNHHYTASPPRTSVNNYNGGSNSGAYGNSNNYNINNPPSNAHPNNNNNNKPTKKTNEYDKHPNEVVKNEELTYNNGASSSLTVLLLRGRPSWPSLLLLGLVATAVAANAAGCWLLPVSCYGLPLPLR